MSYGYFSKYDREVMRVFQILEHHAKIVKLGRYDLYGLGLEEGFIMQEDDFSLVMHLFEP